MYLNVTEMFSSCFRQEMMIYSNACVAAGGKKFLLGTMKWARHSISCSKISNFTFTKAALISACSPLPTDDLHCALIVRKFQIDRLSPVFSTVG